jgi:hypothetical protein
MNTVHEMLPQDEIFLCGLFLLLGLVAGFAYGLFQSWRASKTA